MYRFKLKSLIFIILLAATVALYGCSDGDTGPAGPAGATGPAGPAGPAGQDGQDVDPATVDHLQAQIDAISGVGDLESCAICHKNVSADEHQDIYNEYSDTSDLGLTIDSVASVAGAVAGTFDTTVTFSITKGGDYLDDAVASVTGMVNTRVRSFKENGFDLKRSPSNSVEDALQVYYDDLIVTLVKALKQSVMTTTTTNKVDRPIPVVLSGGTAKVSGFKDRFEQVLKAENIPLDFSKIRVAKDPLTATAKGALMAAMHEN